MHDNVRLRILFIPDVIGTPGRTLFQKYASKLKEQYDADVIIVNGENSAADGRGITARTMRFFKHAGANVVTSGNHIWAKKDIYPYLQEHDDLLRPANFPTECPGKGVTIIDVPGARLGVMNIQGRTFMREQLACPFRTADTLLSYLKTQTKLIFCDFHAETTAEKRAMAFYLDGRISAFVGTHTHVQTADPQILPKGTAYLTDGGMVGALNSMIGMKKESVLPVFLKQMPSRFMVEDRGPMLVSAVIIDIDKVTGKGLGIEPIRIIDDTLNLDDSTE